MDASGDYGEADGVASGFRLSYRICARRISPLGGDQTSMPAQDRVRRDNRRTLCQEAPANALALRREMTTLFVREPEPSPIELPLEDAVLFKEVLQDLLLLAVDPSRQREKRYPKRHAVGRHRPIVMVRKVAHCTELRLGRVCVPFGHA